MAALEYEGRHFEVRPGETVLDALLAGGVDAPHSCRSGHCRTCLARVVEGSIPRGSQVGLKDAWRELGLVLTCCTVPETDLVIAPVGGLGLEVGATITETVRLAADVVRVRMTLDAPLEHRGGQYVTLVRGDGLARSYSTANVPDRDPFLELHVRVIAGGSMSGWLAGANLAGERVAIRGPDGECFYVADRTTEPLLLVGAGTGLAPLWAVAQDALRRGHTGRIVLVHGAVEAKGLYLVEELRELTREHGNFEYVGSVLRGEPEAGIEIGPIDALIRARFPSLRGWRVYLCGNPELVFDLRKKVFLAGASTRDIHADAFVGRPTRAA